MTEERKITVLLVFLVPIALAVVDLVAIGFPLFLVELDLVCAEIENQNNAIVPLAKQQLGLRLSLLKKKKKERKGQRRDSDE